MRFGSHAMRANLDARVLSFWRAHTTYAYAVGTKLKWYKIIQATRFPCKSGTTRMEPYDSPLSLGRLRLRLRAEHEKENVHFVKGNGKSVFEKCRDFVYSIPL